MQVFVLGTLESPTLSAAFRKHPWKEHTFTSPSSERGMSRALTRSGEELRMKDKAEGWSGVSRGSNQSKAGAHRLEAGG